VTGDSLAKACSAFANTYGGLLVVGVADEDDTLSGIEPVAAEAQLWVKDTLRGLVLPMPPFRARWLPTEGGRGLLLILVEESATTPHLLTRSGAIYVRNPGSSDPVPIGDQRRLLDLTQRGEQAVAKAREAARGELRRSLGIPRPTETLVLAPTGVSSDFEARLFEATTPETLGRLTWGPPGDPNAEGRNAGWGQHRVWVRRTKVTPIAFAYRSIEESVLVSRSGAVAITRGFARRDDLDFSGLEDNELRSYLGEALAAARAILSEFGGHGDLRLVYEVDLENRGLLLVQAARLVGDEYREPFSVETDTTFDDPTAEERVFAELLRAVGVGP
jgi:hypothetical protein